MQLLDVPDHCRTQVAAMLGREDELNSPQPDPVQVQEPVDADTDSNSDKEN